MILSMGEPLNIKILVESNPLKSRVLVQRLAVTGRPPLSHTGSHTGECEQKHSGRLTPFASSQTSAEVRDRPNPLWAHGTDADASPRTSASLCELFARQGAREATPRKGCTLSGLEEEALPRSGRASLKTSLGAAVCIPPSPRLRTPDPRKADTNKVN